jgi:hypothetical protein
MAQMRRTQELGLWKDPVNKVSQIECGCLKFDCV